ncbi:hypothetical protein BpHYR1_023527 [Brachionus plicatilis]|uniref:Uncharacterized protein n=1 Tax=Brachionus plicatilis TaxID=10195 RepID=A0A3M7SCB9_BRAPC|nr:hypothetical protein BpHYR1_023527 [Brachionus plicatilis]
MVNHICCSFWFENSKKWLNMQWLVVHHFSSTFTSHKVNTLIIELRRIFCDLRPLINIEFFYGCFVC